MKAPDKTANLMLSYIMALKNVVAKGTLRHERSGLDPGLNNVTRIITKVDENINPLSIRDQFID